MLKPKLETIKIQRERSRRAIGAQKQTKMINDYDRRLAPALISRSARSQISLHCFRDAFRALLSTPTPFAPVHESWPDGRARTGVGFQGALVCVMGNLRAGASSCPRANDASPGDN